MSGNSIFTREWCCVLALSFCFPLGSAEAKFVSLYSFTGGSDGGTPEESLLLDNDGRLYGTAFTGGSHNNGAAFELAPNGGLSVLHTFFGKDDGANPIGALVRGKRGDLYGTTVFGGSDCDCGIVFRFAPDGSETVLHTFRGGADGARPLGRLIRDDAGNLYGATYFGGSGCEDCGTIFELQPDGTEVVLHAFSGDDGRSPGGDLIRDESGNIYGVAQFGGGGDCDCGVVFKLAPDGHETVVHRFGGRDGASGPSGGVVRDDAGNLYGVAIYGGAVNCRGSCGAVFKIAADGSETVLHAFQGGDDGATPFARLVEDSAGNLYGTTYAGAGGRCHTRITKGCGMVFKIAPDGTETILHAFRGTDGSHPVAGLIADKKGRLYGTTSDGGTYGYGTLFKLHK